MTSFVLFRRNDCIRLSVTALDDTVTPAVVTPAGR